jgi:uracil-DNA glycosylase
MRQLLTSDWSELFEEEWRKPYLIQLIQELGNAYETSTIYPAYDDLFQAMQYTSYADTKVVILGQDPYHGEGQAHGLSFSVLPGVAIPPSLRNIFRELQSDIGCPIPADGCLTAWAQQGVLLLNSVLSVRAGEPQSHRSIGWETFTDRVISLLNDKTSPVVFILWGNDAQQKKRLIQANQHAIICSVHPSPLSAYRGFLGSKPFSTANHFLRHHGLDEIDWNLTSSNLHK